ncbi:unnamed protein product [Periconia digitata]|uniref:Sulfatase-modifying factor enzyme-like domain-containing protein n=1 Tax=Periconia digitata TaxID=1303443 RepID=A0A9W4U9H5_9PLEO|nr:unnamed protein product [Periconia digitata]
METPYITPLIKFTHTDLAAKGLRKRDPNAARGPPIYFTAAEIVRDNRLTLIEGPTGTGKTTFAKHLCSAISKDGRVGPTAVLRNEEGLALEERWDCTNVEARYFDAQDLGGMVKMGEDLHALWGAAVAGKHDEGREVLFVVDGVEFLEATHLATIVKTVREAQNLRLLLLRGLDPVGSRSWVYGRDVQRFSMLPLLESQRRRTVGDLFKLDAAEVTVGTGVAAALPVHFTLALETKNRGDSPEELVDAWLSERGERATVDLKAAFDVLEATSKTSKQAQPTKTVELPPFAKHKAIQQLLAARHLLGQPLEAAVSLFSSSPSTWWEVLASMSRRLHLSEESANLIEKLVNISADHTHVGALLAAKTLQDTEYGFCRETIISHMLTILDMDIPIHLREEAGAVLSRLGDPRDLTALATIPVGRFTMGSWASPDTQPVQLMKVTKPFKIGIHPVINSAYAKFIKETGREWKSEVGKHPQHRNVPATDVSWYDAQAYCIWLTSAWRKSKRIDEDEYVRLPTEPEWEYAARGSKPHPNKFAHAYPWGPEFVTNWDQCAKDFIDSANFADTGFDRPVAVGLFPRGMSPFGCFDMAGNVWEWCSTIWGDHTRHRMFLYPYIADDGREELDADWALRRVLRGGSFAAPAEKISVSYRGHLEPGDSWRGNGFRIVVSKVSD